MRAGQSIQECGRCLPLAQQQSHKGGICPPAALTEGSLAVCRGGVGGVKQTRGEGISCERHPDLLRRREHTTRGMRVRSRAELLDQTRSRPPSTSPHTPPANFP